jgi:SAM-dependent methyltransferase
MGINEAKLNEFMGKFVGDLGAAMHAPLVLLGAELGLYKAMNGAGPLSPADLAVRTKTDERYVREWLSANAASGYVQYLPDTGKYELSPEQGMALADPQSPAYAIGAFKLVLSLFRDYPKFVTAFRTGKGLGWHEHDVSLFEGTEEFFRPNYVANLVTSWLPALEGVTAKLEKGARVADVGCGHGAATILMAQRFPKSKFVGYDYHRPSIERAKELAQKAGVQDRVTFEVAASKDFPGGDFDLVAFFDCLHDMGDPVGAAKHVRKALKADGTWMVVEPFAHDRTEANMNPVGRVFYSASTLICTPASRAQEVGLALGAQAGESRLRAITEGGGFSRFRRAAETPFNLVLEARP